jgi:hypothetical protein
MSDWTAEDLDTIGAADELRIAALRPDGSLRPYTRRRDQAPFIKSEFSFFLR